MVATTSLKTNNGQPKSIANQQRNSIVKGVQASNGDEGVINDGSISPSSSIVSVVSATPADYAPSPNTCNQALARANQLRVQSMLRQLLASEDDQRLSLLRLLRKLLRQLDYKLGWLAQVDLLETIERLLRDETSKAGDSTWRVLNDATQLLTEAYPKLPIEPDWVSLEPMLGLVVENLGHARSELRRSSLLLINFLINHYNAKDEDPQNEQRFQQLLQLLIDRGLTNCHNEQAQKGAILSLPLIISRHTVEGHDLLQLVRALADLLVGAQSKLFYSLFLCLQRLNQVLGERRFISYLNQCQPEAKLLYKQAASRNNSLASNITQTPRESIVSLQQQPANEPISREVKPEPMASTSTSTANRQVTFEECQVNQDPNTNHDDNQNQSCETPNSIQDGFCKHPSNQLAMGEAPNGRDMIADSPIDSMQSGSSPCSDDQQIYCREVEPEIEQDQLGPIADLMSEVSSTCSSEANLVNPAHYMNQAALNGHPMDSYMANHGLAGKVQKRTSQSTPGYNNNYYSISSDGLAINTLGVCCSPTVDLGGPQSIELRFGIFPKHLIQVSLSPATGRHHHHDRLEALNEMMCIIRDSPINHLAILTSYLEPFIDQFLARLLEAHGDYQCGLVAIDMIETIVIKTKLSTLQYVRPMVQLLVRALADTRSFYRENTVRVIHKMMAYLPPQHVIDALFEHKHHRSALVREQLVDRVTGAILTYDRQEFNLTKLCYHVLPLLADHNQCVRLAAIECIASLAHALGPDRIGTLLTAAEAVQTGCDYDGLLDAIQARLMRRTLPRCNPDGSIKHVIRPFLSHAQAHLHQEHRAADVRWVKEAPSSHQHLHQATSHAQQTADDSEARIVNNQPVHAHRPGVYSPTIGVEMSHNRRASLAPVEFGESNNYHRNVRNKEESVQRNSNIPANVQRDESTGDDAEPETIAIKPNEDQISENRTMENGKNTQNRHGLESDSTTANTSNSRQRKELITRDESAHEKQSYPKEIRTSLARSSRDSRSGSTDSNNSNKILFQYYLGKFRQSLSGPNGIMAGSMSDTVQAYELSRRRSRQQQTSFDYDSDSVGQIPISTTNYKTTFSKLTHDPTTENPRRSGNMNYTNDTSNNQETPRKSANLKDDEIKVANQSEAEFSENSKEQKQSNNNSFVSDRKKSIIADKDDSKPDELVSNTKRTSNRRSLQRHGSKHSTESADLNEHDLMKPDEFDKSDPNIHLQDRESIHQEAKESNSTTKNPMKSPEQSVEKNDDGLVDRFRREDSFKFQSDEQQSLSSAASKKSDRQSRSREKGSQEHRGFDDIETSLSENANAELTKHRQSKSQPPDRNRHSNSSTTPQNNNQKHPQSKRLTQKSSTRSIFSDHLDGGDSINSVGRYDQATGGTTRRAISVSPGSINGSMNIRQILETVAVDEGPFQEPTLAMRVALDALGGNCWSTKVEGILAIIRLAAHHPEVMMSRQHETVTRVAQETTNLRSTVSRAAIFALGDFAAKLGRSLEPELDCIVQALLQKSCENTAFIRDDIRRSFSVMLDHITQWRLATSLISHGANHKNLLVRRMASQFIAALVQRMGPAKCLVGARDISGLLLPAAAKMTQDSSPHTRYYGRLIVSTLLQHGSFDRLMRKKLTPSLYRSLLGTMESIKRRGPGEPPNEV